MSARRRRALGSLSVAVALVLSACGGGGGGSAGGGGAAGGGDAPAGPVVVGLQPSVDGWSFPNFPSSSFPEVNFGTADVVSMFGSDESICVGGVAEPCELTAEAAAWARMVNQARASGHCEGLVVLASSRFNNKETPETVKLPTVDETLGAIMRAFATQFIPEVQESIGKWMSMSLADKVAELKRSLATGKLEYTLGVYVAEGGHAVLPYAVEYPAPDLARIMIYDSNWPAKNRYVDVDLKAETWRFSFAGEDPEADPAPWTGGPADMDLTPFSAREGTCPFCGKDVKVAKTTLLIRSANLEWSVESGDQVITPETGVSTDGASAQPVKGISITSTSPQSGGGRSSYDYMLQIPNELLDEFLGSQESTTTTGAPTGRVNLNFSGPSSVFALTPSGIAEVKTEGKSNEPINVTRNSIKTKDPSANVTLASENLVANASGSQVELQTSDTGMQVTVTAPNGQVITQDVTPDQPVVQMVADPNSGGITVLAQDSTGTVQQTNVAPDGTQTTQTVDPGALNLNSTAVELPAGLESKPIESLPPLENRNLANPDYKPDTPYVAPTTVAPRSESGGQVAAGASTTVAGRNASSTTVAGRGVNSASNSNTTASDDPVRPKIGSFSIPAKTFGDDPFTLDPPDSDSSGGFRFTSSKPEVATVALLTGRVTIVGAGSTTITATQSAVKGFTTASVTATLTVAKARPEITKPAALSRTFGDDAFTVREPSSSSSGAFTFDSSDEKVARVNKTSGRVTITGAGRTTITMSQVATDDHVAGSTDVVLTVRKAAPTPSFEAASSEIAKTFGDTDFDIPAPASASKGAFTFTSNNANVLSVTAAGRATIKGVGTVTITASQAATDDYLAAATTMTVRVSRAGAGLSGFADVTKVFGDAKFTMPTPKSNGSGAFTYASDNDKVATINATSGEVTILGAGTATITATQAESTNHAGGTITAKITVDKAAPTITKFTASNVAFGDEFTLAPESPSKGAFAFSTDKSDVFDVNASTGVVKVVGMGTATLTVRQAATPNYEAASKSITVTVGKATPTIGTFTLPAMSYLDVVIPTAPTSNSNGAFTYSSSNSSRVRVTSAGTLVADGVGEVTITAIQAETTRYKEGRVSATITVDKAAPTLTNFVIPTKYVGDAQFQLPAPTSTRIPASFTYALVQSSDPSAPIAMSNVASVSSSGLVTILGAGTVMIRATQDSNSFYTAASIEATLIVEPAPVVTMPSNGLIAHWTFDSSDTLGVNNAGTGDLVGTGTPTWSTSGKFGGALSLNGSSYLVPQSGVPTGLPVGNSSYTTAAWFKTSALNSGGIIGWGNYGAGKQVNALRLNGAGFSHYWWGDDVTPSASTTTSTWFHVAVTYDGSIRRLYLNGAQIDSKISSNNNSVAMKFAVGATNDFGERFTGLLDNVVVYNRALSSSEVTNLMNSDGRDGLSAATAGISAVQLKNDYGYTGNGNYWIKPAGYAGAAEQVWCDFDKAGGGWVLIGKGRQSNDPNGGWFGTNASLATSGLTKENASSSGISKLSAEFVNRLMNGTANGWDNAKSTNYMLVNRIANAEDGLGGVGDSLAMKVTSSTSFAWVNQFGSATLGYNDWDAIGNISRYSSTWLTGNKTYEITSVKLRDTLYQGGENNAERLFTWFWDGHSGYHGWSAGQYVTTGFTGSAGDHAIQFVQLWAR
jgi:uncharacterized protein YjdB